MTATGVEPEETAEGGWANVYIPTHRKVRDGWGTWLWGLKQRQQQQQIPPLRYGMEMQEELWYG